MLTVFFQELQGHAIKNQDLLIASGTISLKGPEGMSAVDDDVAAAVRLLLDRLSYPRLIISFISFFLFPKLQIVDVRSSCCARSFTLGVSF